MNTLSLDGNLNLPTTSATTGIIEVAGVPFIHNFGSYNTFLGQSAGNLTMTGGGAQIRHPADVCTVLELRWRRPCVPG